MLLPEANAAMGKASLMALLPRALPGSANLGNGAQFSCSPVLRWSGETQRRGHSGIRCAAGMTPAPARHDGDSPRRAGTDSPQLRIPFDGLAPMTRIRPPPQP